MVTESRWVDEAQPQTDSHRHRRASALADVGSNRRMAVRWAVASGLILIGAIVWQYVDERSAEGPVVAETQDREIGSRSLLPTE